VDVAEVDAVEEDVEANQYGSHVQTLYWRDLPRLGVGLGYRDAYRSGVIGHQSEIDFLEIIADHFFDTSGAQEKLLRILTNHFTLIPHGLGLSIGSADGIDRTYLKKFANLVNELNPPWWSEHIAFTRAGGYDIGHLTPIPKSRVALDCLKKNLSVVRESIAVPLILENITDTITYPNETYQSADFLTEILIDNNCGMLLDVTNLYINSVNHRFCPVELLHRLPAERIVQLHFVGCAQEGELLVDSHGHATQTEIWQLMAEVLKYAPVKGIILERDEQLPPIEMLLAELRTARELMERYRL
jgi:uncharacterized protein (UPF0276 family)